MIFLLVLASLFPLAIYCLILSFVNRRRHAVLVAGVWDAAGMLFAASGFLLVAGPCILNGFDRTWRDYWLHRRLSWPTALSGPSWYLWLALWLLYFGVVVAGSILVLRRRRRMLSIYNVDPAVLPDALGQALDRLGLPWRGVGNQIMIDPGRASTDGPDGVPKAAVQATHRAAVEVGPGVAPAKHQTPMATATSALSSNEGVPGPLLVEVDPFPAMRHVMLRWPDHAGPLRQQIEAELAEILAGIRTRGNPVGIWLGSMAGSLFTVMFFTLLLVVIFAIISYNRY